MKRALMAAILSTAIFTATATSAFPSFVDGESYLAMSSDARFAYVVGLADMMSRMDAEVSHPGEKAFIDRARRCIANMTGGQLRDFVDSYMAADPAYRGYAMASNYRAAINAKCPQ